MRAADPAPPRLDPAFFARDTRVVARALLGQRLVSRVGGVRTSGLVVECEAYRPGDSTAHSYRGRTARNAALFARPGVVYVYFVYGMHYCANLSTETEGVGAAVLVRALAPAEGLDAMRARRGAKASARDLCRGPARLCVALGIARAHDGVDACAPDAEVFVERGADVPDEAVRTGPRVGVVGLAHDVAAPWRWWVAGSPHVSRDPRTPAG